MLRRLYEQRGWFWTGYCLALVHIVGGYLKSESYWREIGTYAAIVLLPIAWGL